ncbi:MAG: MlaD family protein [Pseudomonadota bacterium]
MRRNLIEGLLAGVVVLVAGSFLLFALSRANHAPGSSYDIKANFIQTPGLFEGARVQVAGVPVGYVSRVAVDPVTFDVEVRMEIDSSVRLPRDSSASLTTSGALGDTEVQLHRGQSTESLGLGEFVDRTISPVNLIDQIGRFLYGSDL